MAKAGQDTFPYEAVTEVAQRCRNDDRITSRTKVAAAVGCIREHVEEVAQQSGIAPDVLARVAASMMDQSTLSAGWFLTAADDPDGDFARTSKRMGYRNMIKATTVVAEDPRIEIGLARAGYGDTPWIVVEHVGCDPRDDSRGCSGRDDFSDFNEALEMFEATVERHRVKPGMMM